MCWFMVCCSATPPCIRAGRGLAPCAAICFVAGGILFRFGLVWFFRFFLVWLWSPLHVWLLEEARRQRPRGGVRVRPGVRRRDGGEHRVTYQGGGRGCAKAGRRSAHHAGEGGMRRRDFQRDTSTRPTTPARCRRRPLREQRRVVVVAPATRGDRVVCELGIVICRCTCCVCKCMCTCNAIFRPVLGPILGAQPRRCSHSCRRKEKGAPNI